MTAAIALPMLAAFFAAIAYYGARGPAHAPRAA